jgi:nicotinamidase-related amidase
MSTIFVDVSTTFDRKHTAVLVMDLQADIVAMLGPDAAALVERIAPLLDAARAAGVPVIYVVLGFRPGYPEVSPNNATFSAIRGTSRFLAAPGTDIPAPIAPKDGDVVVVKHRVSAFHGTDLDVILRAKGIDTLLLTGIATSGIVLSTVCHAADADYKLAIASDCVADRDAEVHRVLLDKVFARRAAVLTAAEAIAALS